MPILKHFFSRSSAVLTPIDNRFHTATQRQQRKNNFYLLFKAAILKFAEIEQSRKFRRKIFFFGISDTTQANFSWALIFWLLLYQDKSNKLKHFLVFQVVIVVHLEDGLQFYNFHAKRKSAYFLGGSQQSGDPVPRGKKQHVVGAIRWVAPLSKIPFEYGQF